MHFPRCRRSLSTPKLTLLALLLLDGCLGLIFFADAAATSSGPAAVNSDLLLQDPEVKRLVQAAVISDFDNWVKRDLQQAFTDRDQMEKGRSLSLKRREVFKELIIRAPKLALDLAISKDDFYRLPESIRENVERPFSAYGDLLVHVFDDVNATGKLSQSRIQREVVIDGKRFEAFVYGRREAMTTKLNIPLHGIILDEIMAVNESPARKLEAGGKIAAELGGKVEYFSDLLAYESHIDDLIRWESKIGPLASDEKNSQLTTSSWTMGTKKVLVIRVDFPDRPGEPIDALSNLPFTEARASNLMSNEIAPFFANNSYNKVSIQHTVTPVVRLPQTQAHYAQQLNAMLSDARTAARAVGFETNNFELDIVAFSSSPLFPFAGLGNVGGKGIWANGFFNFPVLSHELGHNFGLHHANLWRTTDGSVIGPGNDRDGEDLFDRMGPSNDSRFHFNVRYKRNLDWLDDANVQDITTDGVYRVFAQDSLTPAGIRALKIRKEGSKNYWVEFRQLITDNPNVMNGATIRWDKPNSSQTQLLDMTPGTSNLQDAPLLVGQTFADNENHIRITIIGKGNTTPESLDVKVELNVGCSFNLAATSQTFPPSGGQGIATINTQPGCILRKPATSTQEWVVPTVEGTSSGTITQHYTVAPNSGLSSRSASLNIAEQVFTVQQAACAFTLDPVNRTLSASGGEGNIIISSQAGCSPVITISEAWISVVSSSANSVKYIVAANYDVQSRTGSISVSGQLFTIQQSGASTPCSISPSGLVAWWRGEGNALDQTGTNNGNALSGMSYAAGKIGGGFRGVSSTAPFFNKVLIPDSSSLSIEGSLSVEGWLRFESIANYVVLVRADDRDHSGSYGIFLFGGKLWFRVASSPNGESAVVITPNDVPIGQFIHFAATLNNATGEMKLYIDGSLAAQTLTSVRPFGPLDPTKNPGLAIGNLAHSNLTFDSFNGLIDELSIYNRTLAASEIQAIQSAGIAITGPAGKCLSNATQPLRLVLESSGPAGQAMALDSALGVRDPFRVVNPFNWLSQPQDKNTRLIIFLENFQPITGEPASAVIVRIVGANNQSFQVPAEDVRQLVGTPFTQVTFRVPDGLVSGTFTLQAIAHNETSNSGTSRIF